MRQLIKNFVRKFGYDITSFHHAYNSESRRIRLLQVNNIETVLDVGANSGQFAGHLRSSGYDGGILSFEPLSAVFGQLESKCSTDPRWGGYNLALGDEDGAAEINISDNTFSSSLLGMMPQHESSAPDSVYVGSETIEVKKLDTIYSDLPISGEVYLKIDTQGFGMQVLEGAEKVLSKIRGVEVETSLVPLYHDEELIESIIAYMRDRGFVPMSIEPGFADGDTGQLLQADVIFYRNG